MQWSSFVLNDLKSIAFYYTFENASKSFCDLNYATRHAF